MVWQDGAWPPPKVCLQAYREVCILSMLTVCTLVCLILEYDGKYKNACILWIVSVQSSLWNSWLVQQKISIVKYEKFDQIENTQAVVN